MAVRVAGVASDRALANAAWRLQTSPRMRAFFLLLVAVACAEPVEDAALGDFAAPGEDGKADGASAVGQTLVLRGLEHAAFATTDTDAVVYIPAGYDPDEGPIDAVVFLHGHRNCAENVVRARNGACTARGAVRQAYNLSAQLEASGKRAILIVPQLGFDAASSDPGALGNEGGFDALLMEIGARLEPVFGFAVTWWEWGDIAIFSHSGGYRAAAAIATVGGYPVRELYLLDSFYGADEELAAWIEEDVESFEAGSSWRRRFGSFYTGGEPQTRSIALASRMASAPSLIDDRTTRTWSEVDHDRGLMFKRSGLGHDAIVRWYFGRVLAASELPD